MKNKCKGSICQKCFDVCLKSNNDYKKKLVKWIKKYRDKKINILIDDRKMNKQETEIAKRAITVIPQIKKFTIQDIITHIEGGE